MSSIVTFGSVSNTIKAGENQPLQLSRGSDLSAQNYILDFEISHNNGASIASTSDFLFMENIIKNINFEAGAGKKIIDLSARDMLLRQLVTRGALSMIIDKTSNATAKSYVRIIIDMTMIGFVNPKDSLFQTWRYGHRLINVMGGDFDSITNCTVGSVSVKVTETFKKGALTNYVLRGTERVELNIMKKPIAKELAISGTESDKEIKFPSSRKVQKVILYTVDSTGAIVDGCITGVRVKNAEQNIFDMPFETINIQNRLSGVVKVPSNAYLNNVAVIDFAQGEVVQSIDTSLVNQEDTALYIDVNENGHNAPKIKVIFETVTGS